MTMRWSVAITTAGSPLDVVPPPRATLTAAADPFLLRRGGEVFLFYEKTSGEKGELAVAVSADGGATWDDRGVVLSEPFHLSYPQVFESDSETWMIPETRQDDAVRLYRATRFPDAWTHETTLLRGQYADATVVRHGERWWLFAQRGLDEMRLFSASDLRGEWREHPRSPLFPGNRRRTRPGGRVLAIDGQLVRLAQDGLPSYGHSLRAFAIDALTENDYAEHELETSPILRASRSGWNACAMHHLDALPLDDGRWLVAIDGAVTA